MKVKKVFVRKLGAGKMLAFADVVFGLTKESKGGITIKGFRLFDGEKGLWVSPPSQKNEKDNQWYPTFVVDKEDEEAQAFMKHIQDEIITAYNNDGKRKSETTKATAKPSKGASKASFEDDSDW